MFKTRFISMLVLLITAVSGAWAGNKPTGYFDICTAHHGSIRVKGWAYDPDQSSVSIQVHAYIWYGSSVGTSKDQRMPAVGINTDVERSDVNSDKGITGLHGFERYITVPAGTYTVEIFAIDKTGDGNPKLPVTGTQSTHITVTVTGDPYNITYDANGGSDAPDAQQKGEKVQLTLSAGVPTREGYTFKEWNTAQDGSGDSYAPGATYTADGDATLYAQWTAPAASTYTVTLKEGTEDATSWTITPDEATTTGVAAGTEVKASYGGVKKVKSVKAKKKTQTSPFAGVTTSDRGKVIGADGKIYANAAAANAASTTALAMIAYVGSSTGDATYNHGLAIALADESGTMTWSTAKSTCEGKTAITGAKWYLPSQDQWKQMFAANGGNYASYSGLNTTINTAGGTALQGYAEYWSSSEANPGVRAYDVYLNDGDADWYTGSETSTYRVRACLAF